MGWGAFQRVLKRERFHLAVAPSLDTPFNRARSINKVLDHAAVGTAGLYSSCSPAAAVVKNGRDGMLLENDPQVWRLELERLITEPDRMRQIAVGGMELSAQIGDPARVRMFWEKRFDLASSET